MVTGGDFPPFFACGDFALALCVLLCNKAYGCEEVGEMKKMKDVLLPVLLICAVLLAACQAAATQDGPEPRLSVDPATGQGGSQPTEAETGNVFQPGG
jgi:hypothetical protein